MMLKTGIHNINVKSKYKTSELILLLGYKYPQGQFYTSADPPNLVV